jgi:hypothetical protein
MNYLIAKLKISVLSLLLTVITISPAVSYALNIASVAAGSNTTLLNNIDRTVSKPSWTSVLFDGQYLSESFITDLAEDSVISWGVVYNAPGTDTIAGEVWLVVAKNNKFIYFHLTDDINTDTGSTSYGGYTVKIKATMTTQIYTFGSGSEVPVIGNDTNAFLVTTTKMRVNSAFTGQSQFVKSLNTGETSVSDSLIHLYNIVQSYNIPQSSSEGRSTGLQIIDPNGTPLTNDLSSSIIASSSSSTDCEAFGDAVAGVPTFFQSLSLTGMNYVTSLGGGALGGIIGGAVTSPLGGVGAGIGATIGADLQKSINNAMMSVAMSVTDYLYSSLAEAACKVATNVIDDLSLDDIEIPGVEGGNYIQIIAVCDEIGTELVGSSSTIDSNGDVTVTGHSEEVCTSWHYEVIQG